MTGRRLLVGVLPLVVLGTLGGSALLALLRSTEVTHRRTIELVALTPAGLPLALVGLLAAGLLTVRRRRAGLAALALSLVLAGVHAWWLAPLFVGSAPDPAAGPRLVVMAQNLEEGDPDALLELVVRDQVDVLVLTDAPPAQVEAVRAAGVALALPHTSLTEAGGGSVVWSRFPISADVSVPGARGFRLVTIDVPELGRVDVLAVHPTPPYRAGGEAWSRDWRAVLDWLAEDYDADAADLLVAAGDFNATRDHWPLRRLADLGLEDAAAQADTGWRPTWPADRPTRLGVAVPPLVAIDQVLAGDGLVATDVEVTGAAGSDHRGVIATLAPAE